MTTLGPPTYHEQGGEWWRRWDFRADYAAAGAKKGDALHQDEEGWHVYRHATDTSWMVAASAVISIVVEAELAGLASPDRPLERGPA